MPRPSLTDRDFYDMMVDATLYRFEQWCARTDEQLYEMSEQFKEREYQREYVELLKTNSPSLSFSRLADKYWPPEPDSVFVAQLESSDMTHITHHANGDWKPEEWNRLYGGCGV